MSQRVLRESPSARVHGVDDKIGGRYDATLCFRTERRDAPRMPLGLGRRVRRRLPTTSDHTRSRIARDPEATDTKPLARLRGSRRFCRCLTVPAVPVAKESLSSTGRANRQFGSQKFGGSRRSLDVMTVRARYESRLASSLNMTTGSDSQGIRGASGRRLLLGGSSGVLRSQQPRRLNVRCKQKKKS